MVREKVIPRRWHQIIPLALSIDQCLQEAEASVTIGSKERDHVFILRGTSARHDQLICDFDFVQTISMDSALSPLCFWLNRVAVAHLR